MLPDTCQHPGTTTPPHQHPPSLARRTGTLHSMRFRTARTCLPVYSSSVGRRRNSHAILVLTPMGETANLNRRQVVPGRPGSGSVRLDSLFIHSRCPATMSEGYWDSAGLARRSRPACRQIVARSRCSLRLQCPRQSEEDSIESEDRRQAHPQLLGHCWGWPVASHLAAPIPEEFLEPWIPLLACVGSWQA